MSSKIAGQGCCYFWANEERPDFIVFGFTMCHVAMILSEGLRIPIVGFICQPDHKIEARWGLEEPIWNCHKELYILEYIQIDVVYQITVIIRQCIKGITHHYELYMVHMVHFMHENRCREPFPGGAEGHLHAL